MSLLTLQQGPFGVAASARARDATPSGPAVARVASGTGPRTNARPQAQSNPEQAQTRKHPAFEPLRPSVAPTTLFETSQFAAAIPVPDFETLGPSDMQSDPWQPPESSLPLRDRSV